MLLTAQLSNLVGTETYEFIVEYSSCTVPSQGTVLCSGTAAPIITCDIDYPTCDLVIRLEIRQEGILCATFYFNLNDNQTGNSIYWQCDGNEDVGVCVPHIGTASTPDQFTNQTACNALCNNNYVACIECVYTATYDCNVLQIQSSNCLCEHINHILINDVTVDINQTLCNGQTLTLPYTLDNGVYSIIIYLNITNSLGNVCYYPTNVVVNCGAGIEGSIQCCADIEPVGGNSNAAGQVQCYYLKVTDIVEDLKLDFGNNTIADKYYVYKSVQNCGSLIPADLIASTPYVGAPASAPPGYISECLNTGLTDFETGFWQGNGIYSISNQGTSNGTMPLDFSASLVGNLPTHSLINGIECGFSGRNYGNGGNIAGKGRLIISYSDFASAPVESDGNKYITIVTQGNPNQPTTTCNHNNCTAFAFNVVCPDCCIHDLSYRSFVYNCYNPILPTAPNLGAAWTSTVPNATVSLGNSIFNVGYTFNQFNNTYVSFEGICYQLGNGYLLNDVEYYDIQVPLNITMASFIGGIFTDNACTKPLQLPDGEYYIKTTTEHCENIQGITGNCTPIPLRRCTFFFPESHSFSLDAITNTGSIKLDIESVKINAVEQLSNTLSIVETDPNNFWLNSYPLQDAQAFEIWGGFVNEFNNLNIPNLRFLYNVDYTPRDSYNTDPFRIEYEQGTHVEILFKYYDGNGLVWNGKWDTIDGTIYNNAVVSAPLDCYDSPFVCESNIKLYYYCGFEPISNTYTLELGWDGAPNQVGETNLPEWRINGVGFFGPPVFSNPFYTYKTIIDVTDPIFNTGINTIEFQFSHIPTGCTSYNVVTKTIQFDNTIPANTCSTLIEL